MNGAEFAGEVATGETLDGIAALYDVRPPRRNGETDADFRRRVLEVIYVHLQATVTGTAYTNDGRPIFARLGAETDAELRTRIMATLDTKHPMTPKEIVESVMRPGGYTMIEDSQNLTAEIVCADLTAEEERQIAERFPLVWRVTINGRPSWEILRA